MSTDQQSSTNELNTNVNTNSIDSSKASVYHSFHTYPFDTDTAFLAGLSQVLGHPGTPVSDAELAEKQDLVLSARCFYYNRKFQPETPVQPPAYRNWLAEPAAALSAPTKEQSPTEPTRPLAPTSASEPGSQDPTSSQTTTEQQQQQQQPPYPTSFAAIVDLITNNKPIPGIEEIPTTVLELGSSKQDRATRRRKPWEKNAEDANTQTKTGAITITTETPETDDVGKEVDVVLERDQGLLRLLRPDAVPESGLVAKE